VSVLVIADVSGVLGTDEAPAVRSQGFGGETVVIAGWMLSRHDGDGVVVVRQR
jgi:hypothetical protein